MNKKIAKIILTISIILITLFSLNIFSFAATYTLGNISNQIRDNRLEFIDRTDITPGQTIDMNNSDRQYFFNCIGVYCIEEKNGGSWYDETHAKIKNIIDLKDGKVIVYSESNKKGKEYTDNDTITLLKRMSYHAKASIDEKEGQVTNVSSSNKVKLGGIIQSNLSFLKNKLGVSDQVGSIIGGNYGVSEATVKDKNYRARFLFMDLGNAQDQIIFAAEEETQKFGNLKIHKVDENGKNMKDVEFIIKNSEDKFLQKQGSNINWVSTEKKATILKTDDSGYINIEKIPVGKYTIKEIKNPNYGYDNNNGKTGEITVEDSETATYECVNKCAKGNLKVIKVNERNETVKLPDVRFFIKNTDLNKFVKANKKDKEYSVSEIGDYVEGNIEELNKEEFGFVTDENGEIKINNLIAGNYEAIEIENPNKHYEMLKDGVQVQILIDKTEELKIKNNQTNLDISGYVWVDRISEKQSTRNDLYNDGDYDSNDTLLDGITVKLKKRETGETIKETKTANGGAYKFENVLIADLDKYYIEFGYDGLTYTNVVAHTDKDNGSKSAENSNVRTNFNNNFAVVEGKTSNTSITRDTAGNEKHTITYNDIDNHISTVDKTKSYYEITANTDETGYKIKDHFTYGQEEIKYINLGLYEREMPDIRLEKDVENVELSINGYNHVYEYGSKKLDDYTMEKDSNNFNVGVKFASTYTGTYKRAVYEPDYNYTLANQDKDSKLNVYLTYRIAMYNESTTLKVNVNSIVDYYDRNFTIEKIGTGINKETGEITGDLTIPQVEQSGDYNKVIIKNNTDIEPEMVKNIYVRFKLSDNEVLNAFNNRDEKMTYKNIAEVNSYSVFDAEGNVYAGIDKDSAPANSTPGNEVTYEDDTNQAPGIQLEVEGNRTLSGSVFLDEATAEYPGGVAKMRLGDGIYDTTKEHGIEGVKVTLKEDKENGEVHTATTDGNGNFTITDFIPGNYTLTYTWGDNTYIVQNYKGTIWTTENRTEKQANGTNWYKVNVDTRYSDAMDDYSTRQKIDAGESITTMDSTTPTMVLNVELNSVYSIVPDVDRFVAEGYEIKNVDFGIIERARQEITLGKRIKTFKVSLANEQVIADVTVNEDGSLTGQTNHVTYMGPSATTLPNNGFIRLELDNELIQGAKVEVTYEIKATNNSEVEYLSENFYKYGIPEGEIVQISPVEVIDYLDSSWGFETTKNPEWSVKTLDEIKDKVNNIVYEDEYSTIANKTILYTESFNQKLGPTDSIAKDIYVSKQLANSDEISLDNEAEIVKVEKTGGAAIRSISGNYVPGTGHQESDDAIAETVIITPNTGANLNFVIPVMVGVTALIILGVGIILIKKKAL